MTQPQENYLSMARTAVKVLDNYSELWSTNPKFSAIKARVDAIMVRMNITQQGGGIVSTGVTIDKEVAGDNAIEIAVRLAGLGQVYASETNNNQLYDQLKVTYTSLDRLQDNVLGAALTLIYKTLNDLGDEVAPYGVTAEELTALHNAIESFENINNNPRVVIAGRKGHNENVPVLIRELRHEFNNVDRMIKIWERSNPKFIEDYQNARIIIDLGTRHKPTEPDKTENK